MDDPQNKSIEWLRQRVLRHSPDRLLRRPVVLPGGITISAEKHRGRVMVRVDVPREEDAAGSVSGLGNLGKSG